MLIKLTKEETTLVFDQRLNTKGAFMSGIKMITVSNQVVNTVFETKNSSNTILCHLIPKTVERLI
jgi:hypothetical protein